MKFPQNVLYLKDKSQMKINLFFKKITKKHKIKLFLTIKIKNKIIKITKKL